MSRKKGGGKGSFKAGLDERRNLKGQVSAETVKLGALLKQYITDVGLQDDLSGTKKTKAMALATKIWERGLEGDFAFVQFIAERTMGKVSDKLDLTIPPTDTELTINVVHVTEGAKALQAAREREVHEAETIDDFPIPRIGDGVIARKILCLKKLKP